MTNPTQSFGGFFTGLQTNLGRPAPLQITFNNGNTEVLTVPPTVNGGAECFGFTDTATFSNFTISDLSNDVWGLDLISFNRLQAAAAVPGPIAGAGLPGLILASGGLLGRLGLLREIVPAATLIAVLLNPTWATFDTQLKDVPRRT